MLVGGTSFCIYRDSGYNSRWFLEVPFQGSALSQAQKSFYKAMSSIHITIEWIFKEIKKQVYRSGLQDKYEAGRKPGRALISLLHVSEQLPQVHPPETKFKVFRVPPSVFRVPMYIHEDS